MVTLLEQPSQDFWRQWWNQKKQIHKQGRERERGRQGERERGRGGEGEGKTGARVSRGEKEGGEEEERGERGKERYSGKWREEIY